jgi:uncharacterized protein
MPRDIRITAGNVALLAQLNDSPTAAAILAALPIRGVARTWGDEIYFPIPVDSSLAADAVEVVEVGDLGYWPTGKAFCIFFGPTPVSRGGEIRPASAVNPVGRLLSDATLLKHVQDGEPVLIEEG